MFNVLDILLEHIPLLVQEAWEKSSTQNQFLDEIYSYIVQNIILNFDSSTVYITKDTELVGLSINHKMNQSFISMLIWLVTQGHMMENIKNDKNMIHFRVFKGDVVLDTKKNELRKKIFKEATKFVHRKDIIKNLIHKMIQIKNDINDVEKSSDEHTDLVAKEFRIKSVILEI